MDAARFDTLTRGLAFGQAEGLTAAASRRGVLRGLAGGTLAALLGLAAADEATAKKNRDRCRGTKPICQDGGDTDPESLCGRGNQECFCARTVGGNKACVDLAGEDCPTEDECDESRDCPGNRKCIVVAGCCGGNAFNLCLPECGQGGGGGNGTTTRGSSPLLRRA